MTPRLAQNVQNIVGGVLGHTAKVTLYHEAALRLLNEVVEVARKNEAPLRGTVKKPDAKRHRAFSTNNAALLGGSGLTIFAVFDGFFELGNSLRSTLIVEAVDVEQHLGLLRARDNRVV